MLNVFVYHALDGMGRALADLIRDCDADRLFEFLPVGGTVTSTRRVQGFLRAQGLSPDRTPLPFIILVAEGDRERSVLHGASLDAWLARLVDAYLAAADTTVERIRERVFAPHLGPHLLRLVDHMGRAGAATPMDTDGPPARPEQPSLRPAYIEEVRDEEEDAADDDDDTPPPTVLITQATTPARAPPQTKAKDRTNSAAQDAKNREHMVGVR